MRAEVLIVGAGPTGLALATVLQQSGIAPLVVDKRTTALNTSRAAVIHAHTLEVLDSLGIGGRLAEAGLKLSRFSIRDRDRALVRLCFDALPSPHPYLLMLPQDRTEEILDQALAAAKGAVRWGWTIDSLEATPQGVRASALTPEGARTIEARYVVGADGMNSIVRRAARIGFAGESYEESFVLADIDMTWGHGRDEVMLFFSPAGLLVVAPLPGGSYRIVATLDDAPERPGVADAQGLLDARGPTSGTAQVTRVHWSSRFRLHHRVADQYRRGPFFLIGDAAHVHSPAGGQGMNTGLVDACVLGRLLAPVLSGRRAEATLERYEALRRPAAKQVLALAGRLTGMATMRSAPRRALRNLALRALGRVPMVRERLQMDLSGLSRRAAAELA